MLEVGIIKKKKVQNPLPLRNLKLVRERPVSKWQNSSRWTAQAKRRMVMVKEAGNVNGMELGGHITLLLGRVLSSSRKLYRSIDRLVEYLRIWRYLIFFPRFLSFFFLIDLQHNPGKPWNVYFLISERGTTVPMVFIGGCHLLSVP